MWRRRCRATSAGSPAATRSGSPACCCARRRASTPTALAGSRRARTTLVAGDAGLSGKVADAAAAQLPGCRRVVLAGYGAPIWADCVSDHTATVVAALRDLPGEASVPRPTADRGSHAGLTYRIHGAGPALVLLPLFLAPSQWEAAIPALAERYSVVVLGGRHLSGVALLEDRATSPSYAGMVRTLLDVMAPAPGETILEVGCGSGAVTRLVARTLGGATSITAVDINPFLLREAAVLAEEDGVAGRIAFREGNAERLPYADAAFDHAYSVTVLEECDADLAHCGSSGAWSGRADASASSCGRPSCRMPGTWNCRSRCAARSTTGRRWSVRAASPTAASTPAWAQRASSG